MKPEPTTVDRSNGAAPSTLPAVTNQIPVTVPPPAPTPEALEKLARAIHTAYCGIFGHVDYVAFEGEWRASAKIVLEFGTNPDTFLAAQMTRRARLDPEDLCSATGAAVFRGYVKAQDKEILESFIHQERQLWPKIVRENGYEAQPWGVLFCGMLGFSSIFRVAVVIKYCPADKFAKKILGMYGYMARPELEMSPSLQRYLQDEWHLDVKTIFSLLDLYPDLDLTDVTNNAAASRGAE